MSEQRTPCPGGCIAPIDCTDGMPGCEYPEPHTHGFACEKTCAYCHGQGIPVYDPENHPNHKEWRRWSLSDAAPEGGRTDE